MARTWLSLSCPGAATITKDSILISRAHRARRYLYLHSYRGESRLSPAITRFLTRKKSPATFPMWVTTCSAISDESGIIPHWRAGQAGRYPGRQDHAQGRDPTLRPRGKLLRPSSAKGARCEKTHPSRSPGVEGTVIDVQVFNRRSGRRTIAPWPSEAHETAILDQKEEGSYCRPLPGAPRTGFPNSCRQADRGFRAWQEKRRGPDRGGRGHYARAA